MQITFVKMIFGSKVVQEVHPWKGLYNLYGSEVKGIRTGGETCWSQVFRVQLTLLGQSLPRMVILHMSSVTDPSGKNWLCPSDMQSGGQWMGDYWNKDWLVRLGSLRGDRTRMASFFAHNLLVYAPKVYFKSFNCHNCLKNISLCAYCGNTLCFPSFCGIASSVSRSCWLGLCSMLKNSLTLLSLMLFLCPV